MVPLVYFSIQQIRDRSSGYFSTSSLNLLPPPQSNNPCLGLEWNSSFSLHCFLGRRISKDHDLLRETVPHYLGLFWDPRSRSYQNNGFLVIIGLGIIAGQ